MLFSCFALIMHCNSIGMRLYCRCVIVLYCGVLCCIELICVVLCCFMLYYVALCCIMLHYVVLCCIVSSIVCCLLLCYFDVIDYH